MISIVMREDEEKIRWLIDRIDGMIEVMRSTLRDDRNSFETSVKEYVDNLTKLRNNILTFLGVVTTGALSLASLQLITLTVLRDILIVIAVLAIALFYRFTADRYSFSKKMDVVSDSWLRALASTNYLWSAFYSRGTLNFLSVSIAQLYLLDSFAKTALSSLFADVLAAYKRAFLRMPMGSDKQNFQAIMQKLDGFVDRGYQEYKEKRSDFLAKGLFSQDLLSMVSVFEKRYLAELGRTP
jgi:hypothetical protein